MRLLRSRIAALSCLVLAVTGSVAACGSTGTELTAATTTGSGGGVITGAGGSGGGLATTTASTASSSSAGGGGAGGSVGSGPPYPFVLAHGFFGFEEFAGLDFETYYFHVKEHLAARGEMVDTPAVDPFNSSDVRGQQLLIKVQDFLAQTGAAKVNIIGHSQGGLDARVVANLRPDLVASVVTISTPHYGSPVGDVAMKLLADPNAQQVIDELAKLIGGPLYDSIGNATSLTKALELFSQPGITAFNQKHPDSPGVFYASIAGRSALHGMGNDLRGRRGGPLREVLGERLRSAQPALLCDRPDRRGHRQHHPRRPGAREGREVGRVLGLPAGGPPRRGGADPRAEPGARERLEVPRFLHGPDRVHAIARILRIGSRAAITHPRRT
ncbi:MAG: alpha/beta fold hydrolase [Minicystis sp.]